MGKGERRLHLPHTLLERKGEFSFHCREGIRGRHIRACCRLVFPRVHSSDPSIQHWENWQLCPAMAGGSSVPAEEGERPELIYIVHV